MYTASPNVLQVSQKLPQIYTVIANICIGKVAWFSVYICGNIWNTLSPLPLWCWLPARLNDPPVFHLSNVSVKYLKLWHGRTVSCNTGIYFVSNILRPVFIIYKSWTHFDKCAIYTECFIYYRKYILQIMQSSQYRCTHLQYRFAVISEAQRQILCVQKVVTHFI